MTQKVIDKLDQTIETLQAVIEETEEAQAQAQAKAVEQDQPPAFAGLPWVNLKQYLSGLIANLQDVQRQIKDTL